MTQLPHRALRCIRETALKLSVLLLAGALAGCGGGSSSSPTPVTVETPSTSATPAAFEPSVAVKWNRSMLVCFTLTPGRPTVNARVLCMTSTAMYDAWAAYDATANGTVLGGSLRRPTGEATLANKSAAVSYAAYHMLSTLESAYEKRTGAFIATLRGLGYDTSAAALQSTDPTTPAGIGYLTAHAILTARAGDGSNSQNNYADVTSATYPTLYTPTNSGVPGAPNALGGASFAPAHWVPLQVPTGTLLDPTTHLPIVSQGDPASFTTQSYLTPQWGAVQAFALTRNDQFRPPAPPQPGSNAPYTNALGFTSTNDEAFTQQENDVLALNAGLTDLHKCVADYWADIGGSVTPPGHWNIIAGQVSYRDRHTLDADVKMFFALNGALFDASIAAWESKRAYDYVRPCTAIGYLHYNQPIQAWAGPGLGTATMLGQSFKPFQKLTFITPPFPDMMSGHSTFSAAGAEVLTEFSGSNRFYDGTTPVPPGEPPTGGVGMPTMMGQVVIAAHTLDVEPTSPAAAVTLQWNTLQEAADEAGLSRRYGGIHFQDGDLRGRIAGTQIGAQAVTLARGYWTGAR